MEHVTQPEVAPLVEALNRGACVPDSVCGCVGVGVRLWV